MLAKTRNQYLLLVGFLVGCIALHSSKEFARLCFELTQHLVCESPPTS